MKKTFLSQLKAIVFSTEVETEVVFADAKTDKGDILKITPSLKEGSKVEVVAEDGTTSLPPVGDHTLENGTVITVDADGVISKLVEKVETKVEDAPAADSKMADVSTGVPASDTNPSGTEFADSEARIVALEQAVQMIIDWIKGESEAKMKKVEDVKNAELEKMKAEIESKNKETNKIKIELAKLKSVPSISFKATAPVSESKKEIKFESASQSEMFKRMQFLKNNIQE